MQVVSLFIYPVKSCAGIAVDAIEFDACGVKMVRPATLASCVHAHITPVVTVLGVALWAGVISCAVCFISLRRGSSADYDVILFVVGSSMGGS